MMQGHCAYIGLGSNLENPHQQIIQSIQHLVSAPTILDVGVSPLYQSKAVGPGNQPDYINGVARVITTSAAHDLLITLQDIEKKQRRVRLERWGPRTLDLDILLFDEDVIHTDTLTVPHPRIAERNFVLVPLRDLTGNIRLPNGLWLDELIQDTGMDSLELYSQEE